jgi:hypothetical protein
MLGTEGDTFPNSVMKDIRHFRDLDVFQGAMDLAMRIFEWLSPFQAKNVIP